MQNMLRRFMSLLASVLILMWALGGSAVPALAGGHKESRTSQSSAQEKDDDEDEDEDENEDENEDESEDESHDGDQDDDQDEDQDNDQDEDLTEAQAEAQKKLGQAEAILAKAQAEADANPKEAAEILAEAQKKAAELQQDAAEIILEAEGEAIAIQLENQAEALGDAGQAYKALGKLFEHSLKEMAGAELPTAADGSPSVSISVSDLAKLLDGRATYNPDTNIMEIKLDGSVISFSAEKGVLLNNAPVTTDMLAGLPSELSAQADFLKAVLQSAVSWDEAAGFVVILPAVTPPTEAPADTPASETAN